MFQEFLASNLSQIKRYIRYQSLCRRRRCISSCFPGFNGSFRNSKHICRSLLRHVKGFTLCFHIHIGKASLSGYSLCACFPLLICKSLFQAFLYFGRDIIILIVKNHGYAVFGILLISKVKITTLIYVDRQYRKPKSPLTKNAEGFLRLMAGTRPCSAWCPT